MISLASKEYSNRFLYAGVTMLKAANVNFHFDSSLTLPLAIAQMPYFYFFDVSGTSLTAGQSCTNNDQAMRNAKGAAKGAAPTNKNNCGQHIRPMRFQLHSHPPHPSLSPLFSLVTSHSSRADISFVVALGPVTIDLSSADQDSSSADNAHPNGLISPDLYQDSTTSPGSTGIVPSFVSSRLRPTSSFHMRYNFTW